MNDNSPPSTNSLSHADRKSPGRHFVEFRYRYLLLTLITALALAFGIAQITFDSSLSALLSDNDPYLDELAELNEAFPSSLQVNFAFVPESGTVFQQEVLRAIDGLRQNYTMIPGAVRVTSLIDHFSPERQTRLFTKPYEQYSQAELDELITTALSDRLLTQNVLMGEASLSFANVIFPDNEADPNTRLTIADSVIALRDKLRLDHPTVGIHANSEVLFEQYNRDAMIDDLSGLMPLVILACVLIICYCFRSATLGIAIFSHVIFTILATIGFLGLSGIYLNSVSVIAPLVVVIIAVANSVHIISLFKQHLAGGESIAAAMQASIDHNFRPISLAAVTTIIGFSSLNLCSSPAIQGFGRIVAIGIVFAYVFTFTLLPVLLVWLVGKGKNSRQQLTFMQPTLVKICALVENKEKPLFWVFTIIALATFAMLPLNETDFNRLDFVAEDSDLGRYYAEVGDRLQRGQALIYGIEHPIQNGGLDPEFLKKVDSFSRQIEQESEIQAAASLVDVVKTVNRFQNNMSEEHYIIPDTQTEIINYLSAYRIVESEDFPLSSFINEDLTMINLVVNASPMTNQELIDLDQRLSDLFTQQFPEARLIHGSSLLLFARMDELVTIELLQGYSISLLLITAALIVGLRSFFFGFLSVLPNLLPASIVFGIWGLFIGQLDPFVMMLFSISIGLVVDDTVHILTHFLNHRRAGAGHSEAIEHSLKVAGPALTITTMVLAIGTLILIGANTLYFQQAAKLLVPIVVLALVLDFLYLPTILKRFEKKLENSQA